MPSQVIMYKYWYLRLLMLTRRHKVARGEFFFTNCLGGLVVKASTSTEEDPGFESLGSRLRQDFSGSSHTSDLKMALQWLPCQAPGVTGSALGLVGPVSVCCDWVSRKFDLQLLSQCGRA